MKCCVCKKEYADDDHMEIQEFLCIDFTGGYGSVFGDTCHVGGNICQHCLKEKLGEFLTVGKGWMEKLMESEEGQDVL